MRLRVRPIAWRSCQFKSVLRALECSADRAPRTPRHACETQSNRILP